MKRFLLVFGIVLTALIGGGLLAFSRIDTADVQRYVTEASLQLTGKPLLLEQPPQISFLPMGVSFGRASWGLENGRPAAHGLSASAQGGLIRLEILPLLSGRVDIKEIRLDSPVLTLNPAAPAPVGTSAPTSAGTGAGQGSVVSLALLRISDGTVHLNNDGNSLHMSKVNASITELRANNPAKTHVDFHLTSTSPRFTGTVEVDTLLQYSSTAVTLDNTRLRVTQESGDLPLQKPLQLTFNVKASPQAVHIAKLQGMLGAISCDGDVRVTLGDIPAVQGRLNVGDVNVNALTAAVQAQRDTPNAPSSPAAPRQRQEQRKTASAGATVYPTVDCTLQATALRCDGLTLTNVHTRIQGTGGVKARYDVNPLRFALGSGGSFAGTFSVTLPDMTWTSKGTAADINVGALLQALKGTRPLEAGAALEYKLDGRGLSGDAVKQSLNGNGQFTARNIQLHGMSVLPKGAPAQTGLPSQFSHLSVPFTTRSGVVTLPRIELVGEGVNATGKGQVRLPQESMNIALDINAVGVTIPAVISGSFSSPSYSVDPTRAAGMLLEQAPNLLNGTFGVPQNGAQGGQQKPSGRPDDMVRGLGNSLRTLFGR